MAKAALKLLGTQRAWAQDVRLGVLTRTDTEPEAVSIRTTTAAATDDTLALARAAASALAPVPGLLPLITAVATNGGLGRVYQRAEGVSAAVLLEALRARTQMIPSRVAVELAAHVARTLVEVQGVRDGGWCGAHPGCAADEVLVGRDGTVALAGATLEWEGAAPGSAGAVSVRPAFAPPEGGFSGGAYMVGALLIELLSGSPPPVADADPTRHEAAMRKAVIRVLARPGDIPGDAVGKVLLRALAWEPQARVDLPALARTLSELAARLPGPTLSAWAPDVVSRVLQALPDEPSAPLATEARRAPAAPDADRPRAPTFANTYQDEGEPQGLGGAIGMEGAIDPAVASSGPSIAIGGDDRPAAAPRAVRVQPLGGGEAFSGGPTLADMEGVRPPAELPPARTSSLVTALATVCLGAFVVTLAGAGWYWFGRVPTESVETLPVDAAPPAAPSPAAPPVVAPPVAAPPVAAPPSAAPAAVPTPTAAAPASPAPASPEVAAVAAPKAVPAATNVPTRPVPAVRAEPSAVDVADPDEPVRIVAAPVAAAVAPEASPTVPPTAAPAAAPATPGPYALSFASGDASITSMEVRCSGRTAAGSGVVGMAAVDGGTTCRVTGLGADSPLLAVITVGGDRSYTCFRGRSRSCQ